MFPNVVNTLQAPGVLGDFASTNPYSSILAGPGGLVAPAGGLLVGNMAWVGPAGQVSQSYVAGYQVGFLLRNEQALITQFLGQSALLVPQGFPITLMNGGDYWAKFEGGATPGQTVYADKTNGSLIAASSAPGAASATGLVGTTNDGAGSITAGVLTVSAAPTHGSYMPGDEIVYTGAPANTTTTIVAQLTGTTGSTGTYSVVNSELGSDLTVGAFTNLQTVASEFITFSAVGSGTLIPGSTLTGTGLAANTELGVQVTGTAGSTGIYNLSPYQANTASETITQEGAVATGFTVTGTYTAGNGELAKISAAVS